MSLHMQIFPFRHAGIREHKTARHDAGPAKSYTAWMSKRLLDGFVL